MILPVWLIRAIAEQASSDNRLDARRWAKLDKPVQKLWKGGLLHRWM
jgi:hypothetical protein